jgi:hypothetical protein
MCKSECTGLVLEFCCLGVIDFGQIYCMNCYSEGTESWEKKELQKRFGDSWEFKYRELKQFRREVKRKVRALRRDGYKVAETIYFIDPPVNPELHVDHMNYAGEHIRRTPKLNNDPLVDILIKRLDDEGRMPTKSYLNGYGSHG